MSEDGVKFLCLGMGGWSYFAYLEQIFMTPDPVPWAYNTTAPYNYQKKRYVKLGHITHIEKGFNKKKMGRGVPRFY